MSVNSDSNSSLEGVSFHFPKIEELLKSRNYSNQSRNSSSHSSPSGTTRWKTDLLIDAFRTFLSKNLSLENLDAYHEIEQFKIHCEADSSSNISNLEWAKRVFNEYCDNDSPFQLNLDFSIRKQVRESLDELESKRKNSEEYSVRPNLFDPVQRSIYMLLQEDSYPKFIKSDVYKQYLESEPKEDSNQSKNTNETSIKKDKKDKKEKRGTNASPQNSFIKTEPVSQLSVELHQIMDKCSLVINLLREADEEAAEEYIFALKTIRHEIDQLIKGKIPELSDKLMKELRISLRDFHIIAQNLESSSKLVSTLNLYRSWSRIRMTQLIYKMSKAHQDMTQVVRQLLVPYVPHQSKNASHKQLQQLMEIASLDFFWKSNFGTNIYASFDEFMVALSATLKQTFAPEEVAQIKQIIDHSNQNIACKTSFGSLLKIFGPLQSDKTNCSNNLRQLYRQKWFFGFLSKGEAEALIYDEPPGTFMCRIAKMNTNSLHINYIDNKKRICLYSTTPKGEGISVLDHYSQKEKSYLNIFEFIRTHNSDTLKTPLVSSIPFEPWYWGDITTAEAIELITEKEDYTFLVRLVSTPNPSYAATYLNNKMIKHSLIRRDGSGYHITGDETKSYEDLKSLVKHYKKTLRNPLPSPSHLPLAPSITGIVSPNSSMDALIKNVNSPPTSQANSNTTTDPK